MRQSSHKPNTISIIFQPLTSHILSSNRPSPIMRLTFALSLLSGAAALPEPSATTSHKVSLSKGRSLTHVNGRANIPGILASLNATLAKVGREPLPHYEPVALQQATQSAERHKEKTKKHAKVNLNDQGTLETIHPISSIATDMIYYGPVTIGSVDGNAQLFELWVHRFI